MTRETRSFIWQRTEMSAIPRFAASLMPWVLQVKWNKGCHIPVQQMHSCSHSSCISQGETEASNKLGSEGHQTLTLTLTLITGRSSLSSTEGRQRVAQKRWITPFSFSGPCEHHTQLALDIPTFQVKLLNSILIMLSWIWPLIIIMSF